MPMEDTYGIQSRIGSIIVVERWYCCRGSPVFTDRNIHHDSYRINITSIDAEHDISMREVYGLDKTLRE